MNLAAYYAEWKTLIASGMDMAWWQEFFVKFYQAFIEADRWKQYLDGVGTTLVATALALVLGVVLGVLVAMIRTAHDQQRPAGCASLCLCCHGNYYCPGLSAPGSHAVAQRFCIRRGIHVFRNCYSGAL